MGFLILLASFLGPWFEGRTFVNVGNNVGVPRATITTRANENGISPQQAAREIGAELRAGNPVR